MICLSCFIIACAPNYKILYILDSDYLQIRNIETKIFDTENEKEILTASVQVLQDLGYKITETEAKLDIIKAEKDSKVFKKGAEVVVEAGVFITNLFLGNNSKVKYDKEQKFYVNVVTSIIYGKK